jgi:hypothetical protein
LSRNAEGVNGAMQKSERRQPLDRELAGPRQPGQRHGLQSGEAIAEQHDAKAVESIRYDVAQRHQRDVRRRVQKRDDCQPVRRMRQFPGRPGDGYRLYKIAGPRKDRAERVAAEVVVLEGFADATETQFQASLPCPTRSASNSELSPISPSGEIPRGIQAHQG